MKETYTKPEVKVDEYKDVDIITTSPVEPGMDIIDDND